jgi:hypothetical protein
MTSDDSKSVEKFAKSLFSDKDTKILTIWGAGASVPCGVPSGKYIMEDMKRVLSQAIKTEKFKKIFGKKSQKITYDIINNKINFEEVLLIYESFYGEEELYKRLINNYIKPHIKGKTPPYFPSFSHEYFAHLIQGGFFKYTITTNFDEILENVIEDEIGPERIRTISSLSDFERLCNTEFQEWDTYFNLQKIDSYLFKPHGTISKAITLRHTPTAVGEFEEPKSKVLEKLLQDRIIVFLGFGNYNEDFWLLFTKYFSNINSKDIYVIDLKPQEVISNLPQSIDKSRIHSVTDTIDNFFIELFHFQQQLLPYKQKPTRHFIRSLFNNIFSRSLTSHEQMEEFNKINSEVEKIPVGWWYDLRIYEIELLIYLLKTRGLFIQLAVAECPRIKKAYIKCQTWKNKHPAINELSTISLEPYSILSKILLTGDDPMLGSAPVYDKLCQPALNIYWCYLRITQYHHSIYQKFYEESNEIYDSLFNTFDIYCNDLAQKYRDHLTREISQFTNINNDSYLLNKLNNDFIKELQFHLEKLFWDFDIDINESDISTSMRFISPKVITNKTELNEKTLDILKSGKGQLIVSSATAEWLSKTLEDLKNLQDEIQIEKFSIITNLSLFTYFEKERPLNLFHYQQMIYRIACLISILSRLKGNILVSWFAFSNLRNHSTIFHHHNKISKAIYFRREGKSTSITPVFLDNNDDILSLIEYFKIRTKFANSNIKKGLVFQMKKVKNSNNFIISIKSKNSPLNRAESKIFADLLRQFLSKNSNIEIIYN